MFVLDVARMVLKTVALFVATLVMMGLTIAYLLLMVAVAMVAGVFLSYSAMAFLMWVLSGEPSTWASMMHSLDYGLAAGGLFAAVMMIQGMMAADGNRTLLFSRLPRPTN